LKNGTPKIQNPTQKTRERKRARASREKRKELQCTAARVDANELRRWRRKLCSVGKLAWSRRRRAGKAGRRAGWPGKWADGQAVKTSGVFFLGPGGVGVRSNK